MVGKLFPCGKGLNLWNFLKGCRSCLAIYLAGNKYPDLCYSVSLLGHLKIYDFLLTRSRYLLLKVYIIELVNNIFGELFHVR